MALISITPMMLDSEMQLTPLHDLTADAPPF